MQDFSIDGLQAKPPDCFCHNTPFKYSPAGHVITGKLSIIDNEYLRKILVKSPNYREPQSINWKYNLKLLMHSVEDDAKKWMKNEKKRSLISFQNELKLLRSWIQIRIRKLKRSMSTKVTSVFKDPDIIETLAIIYDKYVVVPADKTPNNIDLIC